MIYQRLLHIVDYLYDQCERSAATDYIELGELFADVTPEKRERMLTAVRWLGE